MGRPVIMSAAYPNLDTYASYLWDRTVASTHKAYEA